MEVNLVITIVGVSILFLGLFANWIKDRLPVSGAMLAVGIGAAAARLGLPASELFSEPMRVLEQLARLTVAISVTGAAMRLPRGYFRHRARAMVLALGPLMIAMWLVSGLLTCALMGLALWPAMLVAAAMTPTDPVLAGSIVTGPGARENIPERVRAYISAESGANDGLAYPLVFLSLFMMQLSLGEALGRWVFQVALWEVIGAAAMGAAIGVAVGLAYRRLADKHRGDAAFLTVSVALGLTSMGAIKLLDSDGILAAFTAGLLFRATTKISREGADAHEAMKRMFEIPFFLLLGAMLPWREWGERGWSLAWLCTAVLLFRRAPAMLAMRRWMRPLRDVTDGLFDGWFGPIGVAAVFYATLIERRTGDRQAWVLVSAVVLASVVVHGVTATPGTHWYGRRGGREAVEREDRGEE